MTRNIFSLSLPTSSSGYFLYRTFSLIKNSGETWKLAHYFVIGWADEKTDSLQGGYLCKTANHSYSLCSNCSTLKWDYYLIRTSIRKGRGGCRMRPAYLGICKLTILQVDGFQCAHTGIGVIEGILTHTVWEALLEWEEKKSRRVYIQS